MVSDFPGFEKPQLNSLIMIEAGTNIELDSLQQTYCGENTVKLIQILFS
jgi:hypothetical protein